MMALMTDNSGGPKFPILPFAGGISHRCFRECQKYFWRPSNSACEISPVKTYSGHFGPPDGERPVPAGQGGEGGQLEPALLELQRERDLPRPAGGDGFLAGGLGPQRGQEAGNTLFFRSQEKFHTVVLQGVRKF